MRILSKVEQETSISFDASENKAEIYTADPVMMRKMDKLCEEYPNNYECVGVYEYSKRYIVTPKKLCYPRKPRTGREYTEEERAALAERMRTAREKKPELITKSSNYDTIKETFSLK